MIDSVSVDHMMDTVGDLYPAATSGAAWYQSPGYVAHQLIDLGDGQLGLLGADDDVTADNWPRIVAWVQDQTGLGECVITRSVTVTAPTGTSALLTVWQSA
jgi:hypothetical protein